VKTHVVYKYRAPGSDPDQDHAIKTETMPYEPEMVFTLLQAEGQTFSFWSDYLDKCGDQRKDYKVVERYIEPGTKNMLNIIVTDPESEQILNDVGAPPLSRTPAPPEPRESNLSASEERDEINPPERENATEAPWWEPPGSPETATEDAGKGAKPEDKDEPQERRSWWRRIFEG
jgi:hypothetical protein